MSDQTVNRRAFSLGLGASATAASVLSAAPAMAQAVIITAEMLREGSVTLKMAGGTLYLIQSTEYYNIDLETNQGRISMLDWLGAASTKGFKPQSKRFLMTAVAENLPDLTEGDSKILKTGASPIVSGVSQKRSCMYALDWYYCENI